MRSNLLNLQNTVSLLNRTQNRLSSGNKVNTAIDNPTSFFASQALNSRATFIDSLKDGMGQAIQTVQAADKGVKAITAMIEQSKGIAQSAQSAEPGTGVATGAVTMAGIAAGSDTGSITLANMTDGAQISLGGVTFTTVAAFGPPPGPDEFTVSYGTDDAGDMQSLADAIDAHDWSLAANTFAASFTNGAVSISSTVNATGAARAVVAGDFVGVPHRSATMDIVSPPGSPTAFDVGAITLTGVVAGDTLDIGGTTFTAVNSPPGIPTTGASEFQVTGNDAADMQSLADAINNVNTVLGAWPDSWPTADDTFSASFTNGKVILYRSGKTGIGTPYLDTEASDFGGFDTQATAAMTVVPGVGDTIRIGSVAQGITFAAVKTTPGANEFYADTDTMTMLSLKEAINAANWSAKTWTYAASISNGKLNITKTLTADGTGVAMAAGDFAYTQGDVNAGAASMNVVPATTELSTLQDEYNEMRDQITALAEDSGYKGKNLLSADAAFRALTVQFEGNTLDVQGFDATANGLGLQEAQWTTGGSIDGDVVLLDDALTTLRQNSSTLAGNLSVITVRQDFSTNMINTLTEGANKLTLADANEEGANMLMLQTRQSLSTTALSLSAQAAQSVLRLFQ